jgi:superkiller protein 3
MLSKDIIFGLKSESPVESMDLAEEMAQKAIGLDNSLPGAHCLLALIYLSKRHFKEALVKAEQAFALDPSAADTIVILGWVLSWSGRPEEGIALYKKALRINPFPQNYVIIRLGEALIQTGRYDEAIEYTDEWIDLYPVWGLHLNLAIAYSLSGREDDAKTQVAKILEFDPKFSLKRHEKFVGFKDQNDINRIIDALRKAGMPE